MQKHDLAKEQTRQAIKDALRGRDFCLAERLVCADLIEDPAQEEALYALAQALMGQGRATEAKEVITKLLEQNPSVPEYHHVLGTCLASQKHWSEAEGAYRMALVFAPQHEDTLFNLALALYEQKKPEEAYRLLSKLQDQGCHFPELPSLFALVYQSLPVSFVERIGFVVHTLEMVNHYACIWHRLPPNSFDVIVISEAAFSDPSLFAVWSCDVWHAAKLLQNKKRYRYLVSNHFMMPDLLKEIGQINIRFMYAAGKTKWNFAGWNALYDVILCFGPYHAEHFLSHTKAAVVQMGYPRLDAYFQSTPDKNALLARYGADPLKKTVVWLPTWKNLSSVGLFTKEISALCARYNVLVKLHPLMKQSEPERVKALMAYPWTHLMTDTEDNLPLYQLADFMLFDYGGPPFAAIYTDKNSLLLNVPNAAHDELTGEASPDILLREVLPHVHAEDLAIEAHLTNEALWAHQKQVRRQLRKRYFAPYYGFSAQVAADALQNMAHILRDQEERVVS